MQCCAQSGSGLGDTKSPNTNASHILTRILPPAARHTGQTIRYKITRDATHPLHLTRTINTNLMVVGTKTGRPNPSQRLRNTIPNYKLPICVLDQLYPHGAYHRYKWHFCHSIKTRDLWIHKSSKQMAWITSKI